MQLSDLAMILKALSVGLMIAAGALVAASKVALPATGDARWAVTPAESAINFTYDSNGRPAGGVFTRFSGKGSFDPDAPGQATLELHIQSGSIDLGDSAASAFATSAEWFDSVNHPEIVYRLVRLAPEDGNRYSALGELTIRGKTRPVTSVITLDLGKDDAHAAGTLKIDRRDYLLGVGPMSLFVSVGREVDVSFDLTAHPAP